MSTTPLMEQYHRIKKQHKDAILFFRMGDFYEMFFEDARIGAKVLGITLTSRAHGKAADVPLAGFPYHALDGYLAKMIKAGYRVAICEQVEDPKTAKTIVKREITEIVTPGTAVTDDILETKRNNYLVALVLSPQTFGIAKIDVSTGEFEVGEFSSRDLREKIAAIEPAEILIAENQSSQLESGAVNLRSTTLSKREDWTFHHDYARDVLLEHFSTLSLKGFGIDDLYLGISAAGAVLSYLRDNQKEKLQHINRLQRFADSDLLYIDSTTRRNLELVQPLNSMNRQGTLLTVIDKTQTPMGGRKLVNWLLYPLNNLDKIRKRHQAVGTMVLKTDLRRRLREVLQNSGDLERLTAKFSTGRANARDVIAIRTSLLIAAEVKNLLADVEQVEWKEIQDKLQPLPQLVERLQSAIVDNPPLSITEGGFIKRGYHQDLDKLREIAYSGKDWIARLQQDERQKTGISSLKVNYNKVFGYYIEITKPNLSRVPSYYVRKQTLVNAERFITQDLKEYEEKILGAEEKMAALEYDLFIELRDYVLSFTRE
ncbi:MAG: DNA mismatch repair protein MutS, partial [Calditrichaeota bacterium]